MINNITLSELIGQMTVNLSSVLSPNHTQTAMPPPFAFTFTFHAIPKDDDVHLLISIAQDLVRPLFTGH